MHFDANPRKEAEKLHRLFAKIFGKGLVYQFRCLKNLRFMDKEIYVLCMIPVTGI